MDIADAIKNKNLLTFSYAGLTRTIEPHTYGLAKGGERMLCGFQVAGGSKSSQGGWRMFSEDKMSGIAVLEEQFSEPRPEYRRGDGFFESIIAEL